MTQAFWLAALKTDGPITENITASCHIREWRIQIDPVTVVLHVRLAINITISTSTRICSINDVSFAVVIYFLLPNSNLLDVRAASRKVQLWQKCGYVRIALTPNRHIGDKAAFTLVDRCGCYICQCWIATEMRWNKNAVSRSSLVAALDGWTHLSEKIHRGRSVDAFLRRSKRCGFCPPEVAGYDQLLEEADDQLFQKNTE